MLLHKGLESAEWSQYLSANVLDIVPAKPSHDLKRLSRLTGILLKLQAHRFVPLQQLAEHYVYYDSNYDQETIRKVEPFALYRNTSDNWVLVTWCRLRKDFRSFRSDRIISCTIQQETYSEHDLTLARYVGMQKKLHIDQDL